MRIYLAAPLFNDAEKSYNKQVAAKLEAGGHSVFLPQTAPENKPPRDLYNFLCAALDSCEIVVAICEGTDTDSGTAWEIGYAIAQNKPVYILRTDFRDRCDCGGLNLMLFVPTTMHNNVETLLEQINVSS